MYTSAEPAEFSRKQDCFGKGQALGESKGGKGFFPFPSTAHRLMILMAGLSLLSFSISLGNSMDFYALHNWDIMGAWRIIFIPSPQVSKGGSGFTDIPRTHTYPAVFRPAKRIS